MTNDKPVTITLEFRDNDRIPLLIGPQDHNLGLIEKRLDVSIALRGNRFAIVGKEKDVLNARTTLEYLYSIIGKGYGLDEGEIESAIRLATKSVDLEDEDVVEEEENFSDISIPTKKRIIFPRSPRQARYIRELRKSNLVFGLGPAGTGKTYLAVAIGVSRLMNGEVDRIILSRPAVEAGESLGFLPGDMREKVDPYLRPLYDALHDMIPGDQVMKYLSNNQIEIAPLAFMRGRTLANSFIILDEAQNTTPMQMKMFLTRMGSNSQMVVTGDLTQIDLPTGVQSGLRDAVQVLHGIEGISFLNFKAEDVVRHPLVSKIVAAYDLKRPV